ncbi:MAG: acyl-CoA mutase large subunit family protein [Thermoplasmatota archaeon]
MDREGQKARRSKGRAGSHKGAGSSEPADPRLARWEAKTLEPALHAVPERRDVFRTHGDRVIERIYGPWDLESGGDAVAPEVGFPGEFPFTRGVQPTMYRGKLWTMRQYAGFGSAEESNERYRFLLAQGTTGLSVAFDLPTQIGYDSDAPIAEGEVGKVGVAIDTLSDMETLFRDIPLDRVTTSMTINAPASVLLAMYEAVGAKQGVPADKLGGTIQNDILKEYIARGTYIFPPEPSLRLITNLFQYGATHMRRFNMISVSGYHIREAGATAAQELAFTLANGLVYVRAAIDSGLKVDEFAPRVSFFFNAHNDLLEEIAKFRAARRMWADFMRNEFEANDPESWRLRFHTQTGGSTLTAQQPENNVVRVTIQALAAVLGGTQSLHTNGLDEALGLPTAKAARIALRTQQILAHESGVANTVDPVAGAYAIEALTDAIERDARDILAKIDSMGGMLRAIERGWVADQIMDSAYAWQKKVEAEDEVVVGVNAFRLKDEAPIEIARPNPEIERRQVAKLAATRASRDARAVESALAALSRAAEGTENVVPSILAAVTSYASIGEICGALRVVWGEYQAPTGFG